MVIENEQQCHDNHLVAFLHNTDLILPHAIQQFVNSLQSGDAYMYHLTEPSLQFWHQTLDNSLLKQMMA